MKTSAVELSVNGTKKLSTELNYEDLVTLYWGFIVEYGHVPTLKEGISSNNLPQSRIVHKLLKQQDITYNDFINQFGKVKHVRANINNYSDYLKKYKEISNKRNKALTSIELMNNAYGLPSASWFVKYCPDPSVKSYDDFVKWCGYSSNVIKYPKEEIRDKLLQLEETLERPITRCDINKKSVGFSPIVITRLFGGLNNCKEELGLQKTPISHPKSFNYYKEQLDKLIEKIVVNRSRNFITWKDIEDNCESEHRGFVNAFKREGIDLYGYLKSKNIMMNPSGFSFHYTFDDGERVLSSFEYDLSNFLKSVGYIYNQDYRRDIMYKTFLEYDKKSKLNCDYVFFDSKYIEVVGVISYENGDWESIHHTVKQKDQYQKKMIIKKKLLDSNNKDYLFLFPEDFRSENYKDKVLDFLVIKTKSVFMN